MPLIKWSCEINPAKWQAVASEYLSGIVKP
jgi:hypothetical protein